MDEEHEPLTAPDPEVVNTTNLHSAIKAGLMELDGVDLQQICQAALMKPVRHFLKRPLRSAMRLAPLNQIQSRM